MASEKILNVPERSTCPEITVGQYIFEGLDKFSDKICQIDVSIDQKETYKSVKERSVRVALALRSRSVTSNDVICVCSDNSLDNSIPIFASFFLGATIANLDPKLTLDRAKHLLKSIEAKIIFVQTTALPLIEAALDQLDVNTEIVVFGQSSKYVNFVEFLAIHEDEESFKPVKVDVKKHTAMLLFTSGSTGLPKPLCHSNYSFLSMIWWSRTSDGKSEDKSILQFSPMHWLSGMVILIECAGSGGTRIIFSQPNNSGEEVFKAIEKYHITHLMMVPSFTYELTSVENHKDYDISSLKILSVAGNVISYKQLKELGNIFTNAFTSIGYGTSESGPITYLVNRLPQLNNIDAGTYGILVPGVTLKIVDEQTGLTLGPNEKGEICVKNNSLMLGYYKIDSSHLFDQDGFYKTGDVGYYDNDGYVHVVDRISELIKCAGDNIAPAAIENVLQSHPAVKESVVFPTPNEVYGNVPTAWIVLKKGSNVTEREIEEFVAERVATNEKLRGGVSIVQSIPRTSTGKVMRRQVRDIAMQTLLK